MKQVAVIGPGAIGGTVAAWLSQSPDVDLTVCARTRIDELEVETPSGLIATKLSCVTDVSEGRPVDWIVVATKTYDAAAAATWLPALSTPHTQLAVLQNGVEHVERFAPWWPVERIVPVIVECPAERIAPGRILQRREAWIAVPESAAAREFRGLFPSQFVDVRLTEDFTTTAWRKLCLNAAGAVSALVMKPAGIVHRDDMAELMRGLIHECIAVGRAEGRPPGRFSRGRNHFRHACGPARFGQLSSSGSAGRQADGDRCPQWRHRTAGRRSWNRYTAQSIDCESAGSRIVRALRIGQLPANCSSTVSDH